MPLSRHKTGVLSLTMCLALALPSCSSNPGEETGQAGTGDEQAPDEWGDTPESSHTAKTAKCSSSSTRKQAKKSTAST